MTDDDDGNVNDEYDIICHRLYWRKRNFHKKAILKGNEGYAEAFLHADF